MKKLFFYIMPLAVALAITSCGAVGEIMFSALESFLAVKGADELEYRGMSREEAEATMQFGMGLLGFNHDNVQRGLAWRNADKYERMNMAQDFAFDQYDRISQTEFSHSMHRLNQASTNYRRAVRYAVTDEERNRLKAELLLEQMNVVAESYQRAEDAQRAKRQREIAEEDRAYEARQEAEAQAAREEQARQEAERRAVAKREAITQIEQAAVKEYAVGSSDVSEEQKAELDTIADRLVAHPELKVRIIGHTCDLGSDEYNMRLGMERAEKGKEELVAKGIDAERIICESRGETEPIADNSPENRGQNRRLQFVVFE